jgi:ribosomal-protein-alanine N-acetyltransferase
MRAWPSDPSVAHLIFTDHQHVPSRDEVADAVGHAARKGARAVRTSAMFPDVAEIVLSCDFGPIDRLALLSFDLVAGDPSATDPARRNDGNDGNDTVRLRTMRPWHLSRCSEIDRDAFGLLWGNSASSLRDIRTATPWHLGRIARADDGIQAFVISGAAADHGYLQRLAVAPNARRRGIARALVLDALDWMSRRGLRLALVNTGVTNDGALALYESIGFGRLSDELVIAERRLA